MASSPWLYLYIVKISNGEAGGRQAKSLQCQYNVRLRNYVGKKKRWKSFFIPSFRGARSANPESRDSPMRNCASAVWSFGPSRNDGREAVMPHAAPTQLP